MGKGGYFGGSSVTGFGSYDYKISRMKPTKVKITKPGKKKSAAVSKPSPEARPKNSGLTIPEQVAKARKRVELLKADVVKAKKRLIDLDRQLVEARNQLKRAESLPRRSPLGRALVEALQSSQKP